MPLAEIRNQLANLLTNQIDLPSLEVIAINKILDTTNINLTEKLILLFSNFDLDWDIKSIDKNILPEGFCIFPFSDLAIEPDGSAKPCCKYNTDTNTWHDNSSKLPRNNINELFNQSYFNDLRSDFLSGNKPKECNLCWREEEHNIPSLRKKFLKIEPWDSTMPWHSLLRIIDRPNPKFLELKLSNLCNLKCRSCNGYLSSRWVEEEEKLSLISTDRQNQFKENAKEKFIANSENLNLLKSWASELESIQFYGGEPLLQLEHDRILQALVNTGRAKNISLAYNTNLTICKDVHFALWTRFKKVYMNLSIDAVGNKAEYIRHPCKWSEIESNLDKFINYKKLFRLDINYNIVTTVSVLNVLYIDELVQWNKNTHKLPIELNIVYQPNYLSIKNTSDKFKQVATDKLHMLQNSGVTFSRNGPDILGLINYMSEPADDTQIAEFQRRTKMHDSYRNEDFQSIFPELCELINE